MKTYDMCLVCAHLRPLRQSPRRDSLPASSAVCEGIAQRSEENTAQHRALKLPEEPERCESVIGQNVVDQWEKSMRQDRQTIRSLMHDGNKMRCFAGVMIHGEEVYEWKPHVHYAW